MHDQRAVSLTQLEEKRRACSPRATALVDKADENFGWAGPPLRGTMRRVGALFRRIEVQMRLATDSRCTLHGVERSACVRESAHLQLRCCSKSRSPGGA